MSSTYRAYSPLLGRFITPDTIVQSPGNPQTLNRYSYCGNNPVNFTDPDGHSFWSGLKKVLSYAIGGVLGAPYVNAAFEGNWGLVAKGVLNIAGLMSGNPFFIAASFTSILSDNAAYYGYNDLARTLGYVSMGFAAVGTGVEIGKFISNLGKATQTANAAASSSSQASETAKYRLSSLSDDELAMRFNDLNTGVIEKSDIAEVLSRNSDDFAQRTGITWNDTSEIFTNKQSGGIGRDWARVGGGGGGISPRATGGMSSQLEGSQLLYRAGGSNPANLTARSGESALSFRSSLSNPITSRTSPVFKSGSEYIVVDASKLPQGSVVYDNVPNGHVSVYSNSESIKSAVVGKGKLAK